MARVPLDQRLEAHIGRDVGRNVGALVDAARGGLATAATALRAAKAATIVTGFYIPAAQPPAAETDGPIGAAFLARALVDLGVSVRVVTDQPCAPVVDAAIRAADLAAAVTIESVAVTGFAGGEPLEAALARHREAPSSHVVSIERCGPAACGTPRNARGEDVGAYTARLDLLFAPPAFRIAVGDGGNELGMGSLPQELIAANVAHGAVVACRVPAEALIVAGVSNWGAAALALLVGGSPVTRHVNGANHDRLLDAIVQAGAVDGVKRLSSRSVDNLDAEVHRAMIDALVAELRA